MFSGLKKSFGHSRDILVVLCEMWHARPSDRRAARLFWGAIVCGKMTAFCEAEKHEDWEFMYFMSSTLDDIISVLFRRCPPNKHYTMPSTSLSCLEPLQYYESMESTAVALPLSRTQSSLRFHLTECSITWNIKTSTKLLALTDCQTIC